jgi:hypothetical protein
MKQKEILKLASKYLQLSNDLEREGFSKEAGLIDMEVSYVLENDFMEKKASNEKNVKVALRGQSTWDDYMRGMLSGAAAGGVGAAVATGGVLSPIGAGVGAAVGLGNVAVGDYWFNNVMGRWSKANALMEDFQSTAQRLAQLVKDVDPDLAQQLTVYPAYAAQNVKQQITQRKAELSAKYGLDPNKGFMQTITHPFANMKRLREFKASIENKMTRTALDTNPIRSLVTDPSFVGSEAAAALGGLGRLSLKGGLKGGLAGGIAGGITGWGYNKVRENMRGREGQIQMLSSELNRIGQELTQLTGDPTHAQLGSQFSSRISQIVTMGMSQGQTTPDSSYRNQQGEPQMFQ